MSAQTEMISPENGHGELELDEGESVESDTVFNGLKREIESENKENLATDPMSGFTVVGRGKPTSELQSNSSLDFSPEIASTFTNNPKKDEEFIGPDLANNTLSDLADSFEDNIEIPSSLSMFDIDDVETAADVEGATRTEGKHVDVGRDAIGSGAELEHFVDALLI